MKLTLPAPLLALSLLTAASLFFGTYSLLPLFTAFLLYLVWVKEKGWAFLALLSLLLFTLYLHLTLLPLQETKEEGIADLSIESIQEGKRSLKIKGTLEKLTSRNGTLLAKNMRFILALPYGKEIPNGSLRAAVRVEKINPYTLKIKLLDPIVKTETSLAERRFNLKNCLSKWIHSKAPSARSGAFIAGLLTGAANSDELSMELKRFGLQHILAISGFHFSLAALFLSTLFRLFFREERALCLLLLSLSLYALFLGFSPSVFRAFVMASLFFLSQLLTQKSSAVNNLSVALLLITLYDPLSLLSIGCQFSFLITAALLLLTPHLSLERWIPKKSYKELLELKRHQQMAALLLSPLRSALTLSIAVTLLSLPLTLFHFGAFPLQSLLYNLFFPTAVALLFPLILLGCLFFFMPLITLAAYGIEGLLKTAYGYPPTLEWWITLPEFPLWVVVFLAALLLFAPSLLLGRKKEELSYL